MVSRCSYGYPRAIAVAPVLADGEFFPTTFWLTCPHLGEAVAERESAGECAAWARRFAIDSRLAALALSADAACRAARRAENGGVDPCAGVGVAGQAEPLAVKCLHARLAAALAGVCDPAGEAVLGQIAGDPGLECADARCARFEACD